MQANPVPLSPAPARIVNGLLRIADDERKTKSNETIILCSENKCFNYNAPIYKKNQSLQKGLILLTELAPFTGDGGLIN